MSSTPRPRGDGAKGIATRRRGKMIVLAVATTLCVYVCYRLALPFLPALVWATALAIVTQPLLRWLGRVHVGERWRPAAGVAIVAVFVLAPVAFVAYQVAVQVGETLAQWQEGEGTRPWEQILADHPRLKSLFDWLGNHVNLAGEAERLFAKFGETAAGFVSGSIYSLLQALLMLFVLYYLYRDQATAVAAAKRYLPLSNEEADRLLARIADTVHATIYGTVVVAVLQGALGGLMFWLLGLPAPVVWGAVMGLLAIVPYLGAFVVWAPAAVFLAAQGDWGKALLLTGWGTIVVGLIDNLVYPILVGNRLRQHTVIAFLAIAGGIALFGASGIVLGPVVMSVTQSLLEIWRRRTEHGAAAESA
jgi:predicted PurR-regulated permease PerM